MFYRYHLLTFLWALFILIICAIPGDRIPKLSFLEWLKPDKIVHLLVFAVLCILVLRSFLNSNLTGIKKKNVVLIAVLLSVFYGALIEYLQYTVFINRSGDVRDAIANTLGVLLGWWIYNRYFEGKKRKLNS
ncbi:MAG: VanZ family protein [Bacteroidia bacterium]|nr:VanZ family protein [Bacteroidia bacterium]